MVAHRRKGDTHGNAPMKTFIALCILTGTISSAEAQLLTLPSLQDFKKLTEPGPTPAPVVVEPAPAPASPPTSAGHQKFEYALQPGESIAQCNKRLSRAGQPKSSREACNPNARPRAAVNPNAMAPECEKTTTLLGLCPKGSRPYGSQPQAAAPAPAIKENAGYALRPGETRSACEARLQTAGGLRSVWTQAVGDACNPNAQK